MGEVVLVWDLNPVCLRVNAINLDQNPRVNGAYDPAYTGGLWEKQDALKKNRRLLEIQGVYIN